MRSPLRFLLLVCGMVLALRLGAQDAAGPVLPDTAYARLVGPSVKLIEAALAGEPTRRTAEKARVGALMLAEFAQQNLQGADAGQRATVRDAALQVAALIKDKKYAEAVKLAKELPTLPANPAAKKERLKLLGNHLDMEELMSQFRSAKLGGLGVEALLDELASSKDGMVPAAALTDELRLLAFRTAVAAELVRAELPKMKPQVWRDHAEMMRKASLELAGAVETKNGKEAFAAVERLNASCNKCHLVFRQ